MSSNRDSLGGLLLTVVFLVLIAIAAVFYGSNKDQKAEMEKNIFWKKAFTAAEMAKTAVQSLVNLSLGKKESNSSNPGTMINYDNISAESKTTDSAVGESGVNIGFWSSIVSSVKEEWQNGSATGPNQSVATEGSKFLDWQKTATGAEIIFREKNGEEHKLPLPFKSLGQ